MDARKAFSMLGAGMLALLLALIGTTQAIAYSSIYSSPYPLERTSPYYRYEYLGPARTGLASYEYYYPGRYQDTFGSFSAYRRYTFAAYGNPGVRYAHPRFGY